MSFGKLLLDMLDFFRPFIDFLLKLFVVLPNNFQA